MKFSTLRDDAFLYKDLTQWLRRRTFLPLFFGLLVAGEVVTVLMSWGDNAGVESGRNIFMVLTSVLVLYGIFIALQAGVGIYRETNSGMFEIHMLSGIQPEAVVRGKMISLGAQFIFGMICLAPFLFFAMMHGNVGYLEFALSLVGMLLGFTVFGMWAIWVGFVNGMRKSPMPRILATLGMFVLLMIGSLFGAVTVAIGFSGGIKSGVAVGLVVYWLTNSVLFVLAITVVPCVPSCYSSSDEYYRSREQSRASLWKI